MRQGTYIRAVRFDVSESMQLKDETPEEHAAFIADFKQLELFGLYGFPLWEAEVHNILHTNYRDLAGIFKGYCKSIGEASADEASKTMDVEEMHDFVIDCGLETNNGQPYTFAHMKEQFTKADKSGKGMAGPAANAELVVSIQPQIRTTNVIDPPVRSTLHARRLGDDPPRRFRAPH